MKKQERSKIIMRKSTRMRLMKILIITGLLIGLVYALFPVVWMISCAFKSNTEVFTVPQRIIPRDLRWRRFHRY